MGKTPKVNYYIGNNASLYNDVTNRGRLCVFYLNVSLMISPILYKCVEYFWTSGHNC